MECLKKHDLWHWQNAKTIITGVFFNAFTTFSPTGFFFLRNVVCSLQESSYKFVESSKIRVKKALGTKLHCFYVNIFFWFFFTQSSKSRCLVCTTVITVVKFSVKNYKIRQWGFNKKVKSWHILEKGQALLNQ